MIMESGQIEGRKMDVVIGLPRFFNAEIKLRFLVELSLAFSFCDS